MKGFLHIAAIGAAVFTASFASAQNLLIDGNFTDSHHHASLAGWGIDPLVVAAPSTFPHVNNAAYMTGGSIFQTVHLIGGDTYDLSGIAAFGFRGGDLMTIGQLHHAPIFSAANVYGDFAYDFTVNKTGNYMFDFSDTTHGIDEVADLSIVKVPGSVQAVPEPCSIAALGIGIAGIIRRRRSSK